MVCSLDGREDEEKEWMVLGASLSFTLPLPNPTMVLQGLIYDTITLEEVGTAHKLETQAFPPSEAASLESLSSVSISSSNLAFHRPF